MVEVEGSMQIELKAQNSEIHPRWRTIIERRARKLGELCTDIVRLHVTLVHSTHHLRGDEEVRLLATVPNDTLKVQKVKASMGDALHAAFTALERELRTYTQHRRKR
jgi:ribosomal subunit interface protein